MRTINSQEIVHFPQFSSGLREPIVGTLHIFLRIRSASGKIKISFASFDYYHKSRVTYLNLNIETGFVFHLQLFSLSFILTRIHFDESVSIKKLNHAVSQFSN